MAWYDPRPALDPTTVLPVNNVDVQVFAVDDTAYATPLTVTDASHVAMTSLRVTNYVVPGFYGPDNGVVLRAPGFVTPFIPIEGLVQDAQDAKASAASAVQAVTAGAGISIDATDAQHPAVGLNLSTPTDATNLATNPIPLSTTGWVAGRVDLTMGSGYIRGTINDALAVSAAQRLSFTYIPATAGSVYSAGIDARTSTGQPLNMWFQFYDSNHTLLTPPSTYPGPAASAADFARFAVENITAPAGTAYLCPFVGINGTGTRSVGQTIDARKLIVNAGPTVLDYFDGNTAGNGGYGYRWTGPIGASTSERFTVLLAGVQLGGVNGGGPVDWTQILNRPAVFTPSAHTHPTADITGLDTALAGKASTSHTHTSAQISDASGLGRQLIQVKDADTARTLINAGTDSGGGVADWDTLLNKPDFVGAGDTASAARAAIGAGSSDLQLGTDGTTALAGNGTAAAATKLAAARTINGIPFDGTASITVADSTKVPATRTVAGVALSSDITAAGLLSALGISLTSLPIIVQWSGTSWGTYNTDPVRVRWFLSQDDHNATAPTAYNVHDNWVGVD